MGVSLTVLTFIFLSCVIILTCKIGHGLSVNVTMLTLGAVSQYLLPGAKVPSLDHWPSKIIEMYFPEAIGLL